MSDVRGSIRTNKNQIIDFVPHKGPTASRPGAPVPGQIYFDTDLNALIEQINSAWIAFVMDNDSRLTNSRSPSGAAGGALSGSYPNPGIATDGINAALQFETNLRGPANANGGSAIDANLALRSLGYTAGRAMPGSASLFAILNNNGAGANLSFGVKLTNVTDPTVAQDAATKNYVDTAVSAALQGLSVKTAVRLKTTGNITLSGVLTIDGSAGFAGDRVLVGSQTATATNGLYIMQAGPWSRAPDADTAAELRSAFVFVEEGTQFANTGWYQTADNITLGTTGIVWNQFSSAGSYTNGLGLNLSANQFSVAADSAVFGFVGQNLSILTNGITNTMIASLAASKLTGSVSVANGGTGGTTAATGRAGLQAAGYFNASAPALTADTWSASIAHNLGKDWPTVVVYDTTTREIVDMDIKSIDTNNIQIRAGASATAGVYSVSVSG